MAGLLIPATLTAMLVGITEPLELTFLFISPLLFAVHAVLAASMSTVMYLFGVVGNMGGVSDHQVLPQTIPDVQQRRGYDADPNRHWVVLYPAVLRGFLHTDSAVQHVHAGREDAEVKLYSKAEYKASRGQTTAAEPKKRAGSGCRYPASPGRGRQYLQH